MNRRNLLCAVLGVCAAPAAIAIQKRLSATIVNSDDEKDLL